MSRRKLHAHSTTPLTTLQTRPGRVRRRSAPQPPARRTGRAPKHVKKSVTKTQASKVSIFTRVAQAPRYEPIYQKHYASLHLKNRLGSRNGIDHATHFKQQFSFLRQLFKFRLSI